jgi:aspartate racemase
MSAMPPPAPHHIGIVACSAEGAALCYRTICLEGAQLLGPHQHPEVSLHCYPLGQYLRAIYRSDWPAVAELMLSSAQKLAVMGADVLICPDNTIHQAFEYVEPRSPRPWIHIARVVAQEAARRGFRCLGVTGTRYLVDSRVYPDALAAHGIRLVRPQPDESLEINRIIFDELVGGIFKPEAVAYFRTVIARLAHRGADAVVLGCTELPLIIGEANSPLPTLDSTRLLARATLRWACDSAAPSASLAR